MQANKATSQPELNDALEATAAIEFPAWATLNKGTLHSLQVLRMLLHLSTKQPEITRLYECYSGGLNMNMTKDQWLEFSLSEQAQEEPNPSALFLVAPSGLSSCENDAHFTFGALCALQVGGSSPSDGNQEEALEKQHTETRLFGHMCAEGEDGIGLLQYALLLLAADNDAVAPLRQNDTSWSLASYWLPASHNSCARRRGASNSRTRSRTASTRFLFSQSALPHTPIDCWWQIASVTS